MHRSNRHPPAPIDLRIAGLAWRLRVDDDGWREALLPRYAPFVDAGGGAADVTVELRSTGRPGDPGEFWQRVCGEAFRCSRRGDVLGVESASTRVELDCRQRRIAARGPLSRHVLDVALRTALPFFVADGLLVHAALLCEGGDGWLASGPSGCGKTTLAALFPQRRGCDELVLLQRTAVAGGAGGSWLAHALPFWHGRPLVCALRGVHLLRHGSADGRRRLGAGEAMRRLSQQVIWPDRRTADLAAAWQRLADLVAAVPVHELSFRPTAAVWDLLVAEAA